MPSLADHQGASLIRCLYIGDPTTGKTGSLASLVAQGYQLRILDYDNKLSVLKHFVMQTCPEKIGNVQAITLRDKYKATSRGAEVDKPRAMADGVKFMNEWEDGSIPSEWGPDTIFVLDSLSAMGQAAFEWARGMNPTAREPRTWFYAAQQALESMVGLLTSESFNAHVIVITHISYREMQDGTTKAFGNSIGSALGPKLGRYFNTIICADKEGQGKKVRRIIRTIQTDTMDLITPAPFKITGELPLETGLAEIFTALKG